MVGDRPGDRLADPPGGVGRELVAAPVLVLVDRPHQAGVALLDDVEEGQAAIAVLLGDRDHQAQVAAREVALRLLVLAEDLLDVAHAGREVRAALEDEAHEAVELLAHHHEILGVVALRMLVGAGERGVELLDLPVDRLQLANQRLDAAGPQAALLEERGDASAPLEHVLAELRPLRVGDARLEGIPRLAILFEQPGDRLHVHRDAGGDLLLGVGLGGRDPHGPVEGQAALVDLPKDLDGRLPA